MENKYDYKIVKKLNIIEKYQFSLKIIKGNFLKKI